MSHYVTVPRELLGNEAIAAPQAAAEPVAEVESWTNGSYHRNYKLRWLQDVEAGTKLYTHAEPVAEAQPAEPVNQQLLEALRELYAQVRGESSWLLDDTRGGSDRLAMQCEDAIAAAEAQLALPTQQQVMRLADELESCAMTLCLCKLEDKETYRADLDDARAALQAALAALPREGT